MHGEEGRLPFTGDMFSGGGAVRVTHIQAAAACRVVHEFTVRVERRRALATEAAGSIRIEAMAFRVVE